MVGGTPTSICPIFDREMLMSGTIVGWKLDMEDRARLLALFEPHYGRIVADHVTLRFGPDETTPLPIANSADVVGVADDGLGVEALVVRIGATTKRGDGAIFI